MCSIGEEDFGDEGGAHAMTEDIKSLEIIDEMCKKCSIEKSVIKLSQSLCKTCFLNHVTHKFRATLGSTKIVPRGSRVLLNFSGSGADVCLLDMLNNGIHEQFNRQLRFTLEIVFIDESCVQDEDSTDASKRFDKIKRVKQVLGQFNSFKCHYSSIADKDTLTPIDDVTEGNVEATIAGEEKLRKLFNSLTSLSSKQDFIETIRSENLRHIAARTSCQFVFLSDTTIDLAKRLMSSVALGRGSSVAFDVAFCDDRIASIKFVRPIKDLSTVEVENYIKLKRLLTTGARKFGVDAGQFASIQNLSSQFVDGLQENFSSTVSTVFRGCSKIAARTKSNHVAGEISSKLNPPSGVADINHRCFLCKSFLDYQHSNTLYAIEFSRCVSEAAADSEQLLHGTERIEEKTTNGVNGEGNEFKKHLCHGCRNIFIGLDVNDEELAEIFN